MHQYPAPSPFLAGQPPRPPGTRGPKILTLVGVLALVLATALVLAGVGRFTDLVPEGFLDADTETDEHLRGSTTVPGSVDVEAEADRRFVIVQRGGSESLPVGSFSVEGPDGQDVSVTARSHTSSSGTTATDGGEPAQRVAGFTTDEAGTYVVSVTAPAGTDTTGIEVRVLDDEFLADIAADAGAGALLLVAGAVVGFVGFGLSIGGGVWWLVRADARKRAAQAEGAFPRPS